MNRILGINQFLNPGRQFTERAPSPLPPGAARPRAWRVEPLEGRVFLAAHPLVIDAEFGQAGRANFGEGGFAAVHVLPDGKALVAGQLTTLAEGPPPRSVTNTQVIVMRLNADGSPDPTFGDGGRVVTSLLTSASTLAVQGDGKIIVAGSERPVTGRPDEDVGASQFAAARFNSDGSLDTSFGEGGSTTLDFEGVADSVRDVAIAPDGGMFLSGNVLAPFPPEGAPGGSTAQPRALHTGRDRWAVARLLADGTPDASFDGDGKATPAVPGLDALGTAIGVTSDGKLLAGGSAGEARFLVRFNPDGSLDSTFGGNGTALLSGMGSVRDVLVREDGDILLAGDGTDPPPVPRARNRPELGFYYRAVAVTRLNADGSRDTAFGNDGVAKVDKPLDPSSHFRNLDLEEQADGSLAVGGATPYRAFAAVFSDDGKTARSALSAETNFGSSVVAIGPGGKMVVAGNTTWQRAPDDFGLSLRGLAVRFLLPSLDLPEQPPEQPRPPAQPGPFVWASIDRRAKRIGPGSYVVRVVFRGRGVEAESLRNLPMQVIGPSGSTSSAEFIGFRASERRTILGVARYRVTSVTDESGAEEVGTYTLLLDPEGTITTFARNSGSFILPLRRGR